MRQTSTKINTFSNTYNNQQTNTTVPLFTYGAAGHGKGVIDAMSSFGVKSILRRDIIAFDRWFGNSREIVDYLSQRGDGRMEYKHMQMKNMLIL